MLRRTPFKRKPTVPMKRGKLRKNGKSEISTVQVKLWELCKQITRARHGNICYTCGKTGLEGKGWHTGHMIPKATLGAYLKYDLRLLRPQCYSCNINYGGMGSEFYRRMMIEIGPTALNEIIEDRQVEVRALEHYKKLIVEYEALAH